MKNTIIIGGLLVVAAISGWALTRDSKETDEMTNQEVVSEVSPEASPNEEMDEVVSGKGSLLSLLGLGKSQECTFVVRTDGLVQEGTAFYDGGSARVDTLISGAGTAEPIASYMIMDKTNSTMYLWGSAQGNQGIKMALMEPTEVPTAPTAEMPQTPNKGVTPDMDVDYNCKPWRVDGSVFVPPTTIEFMDMTEMQKMMEGMGDMGAMMPRP